MDNDLISKSELKETLTRLHWTVEGGFDKRPYLDSIIDDIPTVEQPQGEWVDNDTISWECSCCRYDVNRWNNTPFCPNCGAKMKNGRSMR